MELLSNKEMDTLGEIANISIGNAATTLSMMVGHRVDITTPTVKLIKRSEALDDYEKKCTFVQIHYIKGLSGNNLFILKNRDVLCLTNLMMGGSGEVEDGEPGELELSAISEAMNQMMGTSATSMATLFDFPVDISTPQVSSIDVESVKAFERLFEDEEEGFVKISFVMDIEDLIHSNMVQVYPIGFARELVQKCEEAEVKERLNQ